MGVNTFAFVAAANKKAVEEKLLPDLSENCMLKISTSWAEFWKAHQSSTFPFIIGFFFSL